MNNKNMFEIKNIFIAREGKEIIQNVSLTVKPGTIHALMGSNGSGKSSLANAVMGHPRYTVTSGDVVLNGENITNLSPDKKAKAGLFLSPQYTPDIAGVSVAHFLRVAAMATGKTENLAAFRVLLKEKLSELQIDSSFIERPLGAGFSGGEKKRLEMLQMAILSPKYAILDETDSGLDVDALKVVARGINAAKTAGTGIILITHNTRLFHDIHPDAVSVIHEGEIVMEGGKEIINHIEKEGYGGYQRN